MYLANENQKLREKIAQNLNISYAAAVCEGCRNHSGTIPFLGMTEPCSVYKCIQQKGLQLCSECQDFPCDNLHPYADMAFQVPHNTKVFNLCLIKKMGLEAWAKNKAKTVKDTYFKGSFKL
jgi:hypothetical protein